MKLEDRVTQLEKRVTELELQLQARPAQEKFEELLRHLGDSSTRTRFSHLDTPSTSDDNSPIAQQPNEQYGAERIR